MFPIKINQKEERIVAYKSIPLRKEIKTYSMNLNWFELNWLISWDKMSIENEVRMGFHIYFCSISSKKELSKEEWIKLFEWVLYSFHSIGLSRYHSIWFGISSILRTLYELYWDLRREWKKGLWTKLEWTELSFF